MTTLLIILLLLVCIILAGGFWQFVAVAVGLTFQLVYTAFYLVGWLVVISFGVFAILSLF